MGFDKKQRETNASRMESSTVRAELFSGAEIGFADAAERASPVLGQFFERCSGCNAIVGITYGGIVLVPAYVTDVLLHCCNYFKG